MVGETAVVGDDVSMLHRVTLGGSGVKSADRHPKVRGREGGSQREGQAFCLLGSCGFVLALFAVLIVELQFYRRVGAFLFLVHTYFHVRGERDFDGLAP